MATFVHNCRRLAQTRDVNAILNVPRVDARKLLEYNPPPPDFAGPRIDMADLERALDEAEKTVSRPMAAPAAETSDDDPPQPVVDLLRALGDKLGITNVLERLATFVPAQRFIAWLVLPTKENYEAMAPLSVPRPSQLAIPHSPWVDLVMHGRVRDAMIERPDLYGNEEFLVTYASAVRLTNWPGQPVDALHVDQTTGFLWFTDAFVAHSMRIENWRVLESFVRRYPELRSRVETVDC